LFHYIQYKFIPKKKVNFSTDAHCNIQDVLTYIILINCVLLT